MRGSKPKKPSTKGLEDGTSKKSKLSKSEAKKREDKLKMNLHLAEIGQVEDYIKNRSMEVDKEIEETRKRMNLSMSLSTSKGATLGSSGSASWDPLVEQMTEKANIHLQGQKFKEGIKKDHIVPVNQDHSKQSTDHNTGSTARRKNPTREIEWKGLRERLLESFKDSQMSPFQVTETFLPSELAREKEVFILLEEVVDVFQIDFVAPISDNDQALLVHFYGDKHNTFINIKELLMDLEYWDTNRNNHSSVKNGKSRSRYDNDDDLDEGLPERYKSLTYGGHSSTDMRGGDTFSDFRNRPVLSATNPVKSLHPIAEKLDEDLNSSSTLFENERTNTAISRSALADIHALVHSNTGDLALNNPLSFDKYPESDRIETDDVKNTSESRDDTLDVDEEDDDKLLEQLRLHAAKEKDRMQSSDHENAPRAHNKSSPSQQDSNLRENLDPSKQPRQVSHNENHRNATDDNEKSIREQAAENVATQLALENARLKQELGAFDSEFFEELEDLKFKYAKLQVIIAGNIFCTTSQSLICPIKFKCQDTIGDSPVIRTEKDWDRYASARLSPSRPVPRAPPSHRASSPPRSSVEKLAWGSPSTRASSHAMDRAKYSSSLVASHSSSTHKHQVPHHSDPVTELYMTSGDRPFGSPGRSSRDFERGIGYRASRVIDGHDLKRSIKEQVYNSTDQNDFGSQCERRLIFELKSLPDPSRAAASLMSWVAEQSHENEDHAGYISCDQLQHMLVQRLGLKMSSKEISLLAMGFASDGTDKINAEEFNSALQTLFHSSMGAEGHAETKEEAALRLAMETTRNLANDLLSHKKFSHLLRHRVQVLKLVENQDEVGLENEINSLKVIVMDSVSKPFYLMDDNRNGIITAKGFTKIINFFSPGISDDEVNILVACHRKSNDTRDQTRIENDYITEFRAQQLRGSLRGAATGTGNGELRSWLQQSLPGDITGDHHKSNEKILIDYRDFINQLAEAVLDVILDLEAGVDQITSGHDLEIEDIDPRKGSSSLPPLITGFGDLIDTLLSHLESLPSSRRRQCLILLQSSLTKQSEAEGNADGVGYLDGYAVLKALVAAGFPLGRSLRAKFLKDVEEMSGKFNFMELCRFLMSSCCNWSSDEMQVMSKILKAMGVTTEQRRDWIHQLKKDLCLASADYKLNHGRQGHAGHPVSFNASKKNSSSGEENWMQIVDDNLQDGVPASTFLHCLREAGVHLSVDDEATLLDCLDFESQALEMSEEVSTIDPLLTNADRQTHRSSSNALSISLIKYSNFLSVCSRHAGKWYQASPALNEHLKVLLMEKQEADIIAGFKEFRLLLKTFDEDSTGSVGYRPFLISCRRSRILSKLEPEVMTELAKVLAEEGSGSVPYELFLLHMKSLYHQVKSLRSLNKEIVPSSKLESFQLFNQLFTHGSDKSDGTLQPLRRWILIASDKNKQIRRQKDDFLVDPNLQVLTKQNVADLLRDFNVVYSPEDMEVILDDIRMSSAIFDYFTETDSSPLHYLPPHEGKLDEFSVRSTNLVHCMLQCRAPWAQRNPKLALKIKKMLSRASTNAVETLITRMRSFAKYTNLFGNETELVIDFADDEDGEEDYAELLDKKVEQPKIQKATMNDSSRKNASRSEAEAFISKDAFLQVVQSSGLNLSPADIDFLADESDASLEPSRIRVGILLEALSESDERGGLQDVLNQVREEFDNDAARQHLQKRGSAKSKNHKSLSQDRGSDDAPPAAFAIKHLQTLLLNSADVLRRSTTEWSCDVLSLMDGFDRGGGVCTPQDFVMGLHLLSVRLSSDLLANIPRISKSVDMIPYKKILELVFADFIHSEKSSMLDNGFEQSAYNDLIYGSDDAGGGKKDYSVQRSSSAPSTQRGRTQQPQADNNSLPAVHSLVHMVRKRLNIFIAGSKADNEQALSTLLTVFSRFDQNRDEFVTPRNFCLAVSVLMDGDIPLLTKADWEAVVTYFQQPSVINQFRSSSASNLRGKKSATSLTDKANIPAGMVHYVSFVHTVLDASFSIPTQTGPSSPNGRNRKGTYGSSRVPGGHVSKPRASSTGRTLTSSRSSVKSTAGTRELNRPSYQPVQFGNQSGSINKKKPKSYVKSNRIAMSSRPSMFRADYDEDEEEQEYAETSTLSGRGVVGASSNDNSRRSNLRRVSAPRVESRYSAYDLLDESMDMDGSQSLTMSLNKSTTSMRQETSAINEINRFLNKGIRNPVDYTVAIKELNDELKSILSPKAQATRGKSSMSSILRTHFQMEDKNNSGTLSKHSTLAALNGLGIVYHFWSKPTQKLLMEVLMSKRHGVVNIEDFMKIVYLR